ncbi:MAG TPA: selenocysteine-specific translation elongation factor [Gemmatimonadales bacterium]|nr:selenocysteine-specific translation elongation factor [Gemmatimonadales bacterium]
MEVRLIVGTAGHVDHGKSALVAALTGRAMDRLAEERRRGITIDLNFAPLDLDGVLAGVVDVPGHEDFVRTMVAGAAGFDLALLVVAADEGIMPQTEEHLAILEQLGVPAGIPVVTKSDLVDAEWLELVLAELAERVSGSPVAFDAPLAVSVVTGAGLGALRARLAARARAVRPRPAEDVFRLPVDRTFSVPGVGTVVTGTAWSGTVGVGDAVRLLPGGAEGRIRSIESHGQALDRSRPGARTALGIAGLERAAVRRGHVVVTPDPPWTAAESLDVALGLLPSARPLVVRARVRLHHGTSEVMARVWVRGPIEPGRAGLARLRLEAPVVARGGDRFVLRSFSPVSTIGGGTVLDPDPPGGRAAWPDGLADSDPAARLGALVSRRPFGALTAALPLLLGGSPAAAVAAARTVRYLQQIGEHWIHRQALTDLAERAATTLDGFHRLQPTEPGMPLATLRQVLRAPDWLADAALGELAQDGRLRILQSVARRADFEPRVAAGEAEIERYVDILRRAGLTPPSLAELERETGRRDVAAILRVAAARRQVEAVERDRFYDADALRRFAEAVRELGAIGDIHVAALRDRLGLSRKFLIPLLEWADAQGITVRAGDVRRLALPRS